MLQTSSPAAAIGTYLTSAGNLIAVVATVLLLVMLYLLVVQPWMARWGSTLAERERVYPGDELWPNPDRVETRAISIHAPVEQVWPWLDQIGQDRGGFYSFSILENLFRSKIHNADHILSDLPPLQAGSRLWYTPPDAFGGTGFSDIAQVEPGHAVVLVGHFGPDLKPNGTWSFFLEPAGEDRTRLIARGLGGRAGQPRFQRLFERLVLVPTHFVMERRMLIGIKQRAEGQHVSIAPDVVEVVPWFVALALTLITAVVAVVAGQAWPWIAIFVASATALLVLPLLRPHISVSLAWAVLPTVWLAWSVL